MKYLIEKGIIMPLCAVQDDLYFDYLTGQVITNENTLKFIENGIKNKTIEIKEISLNIYKIGYIFGCNKLCTVAYNYIINGCSNYLGLDKRVLYKDERNLIINKLMNGTYIEELIWGDMDE